MRKVTLQHRTCSGLTLIELMIVLVAGILVFGLILEIFITTNTATKRENIQATMVMEARLIALQVDNALNAFSYQISTPVSQSEFLDERIAFPRLDFINDHAPLISVIETREVNGRKRIVMVDTPLEATDAQQSPEKIPGLNDSLISTSIEFSYAEEMKGIEPVWQDSLSADMTPLLVGYQITINDLQGIAKPLQISSACNVRK